MKLGRHILRCVVLVGIATVIGVSALVSIQFVPSTALQRNARTALQVFNRAERQRPALIGDINATRVEYYADAHTYQLSFGEEGVSALKNALYPRAYIDPHNLDEWGLALMVPGLAQRLAGAVPNADNGRYWNGFIVVMRLVGSVFSYPQLRVVNAVLLGLLFVAVAFFLARSLQKSYAILFGVTLLIMWIGIVPFCLEYVSVFYLMGAGILAVLWLSHRGLLVKWGPELFCLLGILTAYFDLLTAPLVTLGFPLVVATLCLLHSNKGSETRFVMRSVLMWIGAWLFGYAVFWVIKIVLTEALFGTGLLEDAVQRAGSYSNLNRGSPILTQIFGIALPANLGTMLGNSGQDVVQSLLPAWIRTTIALLLLAVPPLTVWVRARRADVSIGSAGALAIIASLPFLRLIATSVHADWNSFFTFREFGVAYFALYAFCLYTLDRMRATLNQQGEVFRSTT